MAVWASGIDAGSECLEPVGGAGSRWEAELHRAPPDRPDARIARHRREHRHLITHGQLATRATPGLRISSVPNNRTPQIEAPSIRNHELPDDKILTNSVTTHGVILAGSSHQGPQKMKGRLQATISLSGFLIVSRSLPPPNLHPPFRTPSLSPQKGRVCSALVTRWGWGVKGLRSGDLYLQQSLGRAVNPVYHLGIAYARGVRCQSRLEGALRLIPGSRLPPTREPQRRCLLTGWASDPMTT